MRGRYLTPDAPITDRTVCRTFRVPNDPAFLSLLSGAVASLVFASNWERFGSLTPEQAADYFKQALLHEVTVEGCMIGEIKAFLTDELPSNVLLCDGSFYDRDDYPILYDKLPAQFRVSPTRFLVPNLIDRSLIGADPVPLSSLAELGEYIGSREISIDESNLPTHSHANLPHSHTDTGHIHSAELFLDALIVVPGEAPGVVKVPLIPGSTGVGFANLLPSTVDIQPAGAGLPFEVTPPAMGVIYGIVAR